MHMCAGLPRQFMDPLIADACAAVSLLICVRRKRESVSDFADTPSRAVLQLGACGAHAHVSVSV